MNAQDLKWTLASASARRLDLLRQVGINPDVCPADVEEIANGRPPAELALANSILKAEKIAESVNTGILLAADTIVVIDNKVLGKPTDEKEALKMLTNLSGRTHEVITAFSLRWLDKDLRNDNYVNTIVRFRDLDTTEIRNYVNSGDPMDKAGGYGIQSGAGAFVDRIEGCYFNVVGLPLAKVMGIVQGWLSKFPG